MEHLVSSELSDLGFIATPKGHNLVMVSLKSRKVSMMEVKIALEQVFEEISFNCQQASDGVLVSW